MKVKQIAIIGVALAVALGAYMLTKRPQQNTQPVVAAIDQANAQTVKVLVANKDLNVGDRITKEALVWREWPKDSIGPAFITFTDQPKALDTYVGAVVRTPLAVGEPIVNGKIVEANPKSGLMAAMVTPGMRAVTVNIKNDTGVAGFVLPDDKVDVLLTRTIAFPVNGQTSNKTVSSTILENVKVLAIDQRVMQEKGQGAMTGSSATLELSPQDAEKLSVAGNLGEISLVLRSYADSNGPTISRPNAVALSQPNPPKQKSEPAVVQTESNPSSAIQPIPQDNASGVKVYRGGQ